MVQYNDHVDQKEQKNETYDNETLLIVFNDFDEVGKDDHEVTDQAELIFIHKF